jgi:hypothetical protein
MMTRRRTVCACHLTHTLYTHLRPLRHSQRRHIYSFFPILTYSPTTPA